MPTSSPLRLVLPSAALLVAALFVQAAPAQSGAHIGYAYPAGGKRGTSFEVVVGGQNLRGLADAVVSGHGVRAKVKAYDRMMTQREVNAVREEMRKLQARRNAARAARRGTPPQQAAKWTAVDADRLYDLRRKLADRNRRRETPALADRAILQVTVLPDAELGKRRLRLITAGGLTNPLVFCVGELSEIRERGESATRGRIRRPAKTRGNGRGTRRGDRDAGLFAETRMETPAVANGQIMPGDVDRFRFRATAGQDLVAIAQARALVPYLADAVPGWFQAVVVLRDAAGTELARVDDYRFDPDPVLHYAIPADGEYVVEIHDALYRGREDFVYRLALGELPFVASVFPLGAPAGAGVTVDVRGFNLATDKVVLAPGETLVAARGKRFAANSVPFARDRLPESRDREPNDRPAEAQELHLPRIVNGRIDAPGDIDVYRFAGKRGTVLVAEIQGRRLHSPIDGRLRVTDVAGRRIAFNDDRVDRGAGLTTHHADPYVRFTLPHDGVFHLFVDDTQRKGGADYGYRLRIGPPRPGFELRAVPSCIHVRTGATATFTVHAIRRDGFLGPIDLALRGAPPGFRLGGARIPAGVDHLPLTLTVDGDSRSEPVALEVVGTARVGTPRAEAPRAGTRIVAAVAVAADDVMQAFIYRHLVTTGPLLVTVRGRSPLPWRPDTLGQVRVPAGGSTRVRIRATRRWVQRWLAKASVAVEPASAPPGVTVGQAKRSEGGFEIPLRAGANAQPGNLILRVVSIPKPPAKGQAARRAPRRRVLGLLPAMPLRILTPGGAPAAGTAPTRTVPAAGTAKGQR